MPTLSSLALLGFSPELWRDHGLGELPALRVLELRVFADTPLAGLAGYTALTSLELEWSQGYTDGPASLGCSLAAFPRLQHLSLRDCGWVRSGVG